jgi:predicted amidohydrolase
VLTRARAIETQCYVLAAGQGGAHPGGRETFGHSALVDPWGCVLAELPAGPGVLLAERDAQAQAAIRQRMPVSRHKRFFAAAEPRQPGVEPS